MLQLHRVYIVLYVIFFMALKIYYIMLKCEIIIKVREGYFGAVLGGC